MRYFFILVLLASLGCGDGKPKSIPPKTPASQLPNQNDATRDFKDRHVIDEQRCAKLGLPSTHFSIKYPTTVEIENPRDPRNYLSLKVRRNGKIIEQISFGNSDLTKKTGHRAIDLMKALLSAFKKQLPDAATEFVGETEFR